MCISACDLILCLQVALAHQSLSINLFLVWRESHQPLMVGTFLPRDLLVTGTRGHGKVKSSFRPTMNYATFTRKGEGKKTKELTAIVHEKNRNILIYNN
jgi:hypothetical protein